MSLKKKLMKDALRKKNIAFDEKQVSHTIIRATNQKQVEINCIQGLSKNVGTSVTKKWK